MLIAKMLIGILGLMVFVIMGVCLWLTYAFAFRPSAICSYHRVTQDGRIAVTPANKPFYPIAFLYLIASVCLAYGLYQICIYLLN
jgi:hypothetical protein